MALAGGLDRDGSRLEEHTKKLKKTDGEVSTEVGENWRGG